MPIIASIMFETQLPSRHEWPPLTSLLFSSKVSGGRITCWIRQDYRIQVVLKPVDSSAFSITTVVIIPADESATISFAVTCDGENVIVYLNAEIIGSSESTSDAAAQVNIVPDTRASPELEFFSANEEARQRRASEVKILRPRQSRRLLSMKESVRQLWHAKQQVQFFCDLLCNGQEFVETALSTRLRALVCRGGQGYPLLQRIAGAMGLPLTVYAPPARGFDPLHPISAGLEFGRLGPVTKTRDLGYFVAMDLDVWLGLEHFSVGGQSYTNNDALRAIANTTSAHYDVSIEPIIDWMKTCLTSENGITMINSMLIGVGRVVVALAQEVGTVYENSVSRM